MTEPRRSIENQRKAIEITDELFPLIKEFVQVGKTEKEVYDHILKIIDESEADTFSFEPIVAAGANGAEPHHEAGDYVIQEGDLVVIDYGDIL